MTPQTPAEGILKTGDWGTSKTYHIECECTNAECSHSLDVEADEYSVTVTIYTKQETPWWSRRFEDNYKIENGFLDWLDRTWKGVANGVIRRVTLTWGIWIKGEISYQGSIILKDQAALNYGATLLTAAEDVKAIREEQDKRKAKK